MASPSPNLVETGAADTSATPHPTPARNLEAAKLAIEESGKAFPGKCSIVFIDLDSAQTVELRPEEPFESASLVKLVILVELYRQFQEGLHSPDDLLTLESRQKVGGSGSLQQAKEGSKYTLEELAELMITESDNTATQMLTDHLGRDLVHQSAKNLGLEHTTFQRDVYDFSAIDRGQDNLTSAKDMALLLQMLAHNQLPGSNHMHEILEGQKRHDMIGDGFPEDTKLAHKTGELTGLLHDAGIVYAPQGAFVIVMLGDDITDREAARKTWSNLANELFSHYSER